MTLRIRERGAVALGAIALAIGLSACGQASVGPPPAGSAGADAWRLHATLDGRYTLMRFTTRAADPALVCRPAAAPEDAKLPVVVFCHGHGQTEDQLTERTDLATLAAKEGWLTASARLTGKAHWANDEALAALDALVADCVEKFGADPARIYLMGFSMGGGTALVSAARATSAYPAAAVASSAGFMDLLAMAGKDVNDGAFASSIAEAYGGRVPNAALAAEHSPTAQAPRLADLPVYLEHGAADTVVPIRQYEGMLRALAAVGVQPSGHVISGAGHDEQAIDGPAIMGFFRDKRRE